MSILTPLAALFCRAFKRLFSSAAERLCRCKNRSRNPFFGWVRYCVSWSISRGRSGPSVHYVVDSESVEFLSKIICRWNGRLLGKHRRGRRLAPVCLDLLNESINRFIVPFGSLTGRGVLSGCRGCRALL